MGIIHLIICFLVIRTSTEQLLMINSSETFSISDEKGIMLPESRRPKLIQYIKSIIKKDHDFSMVRDTEDPIFHFQYHSKTASSPKALAFLLIDDISIDYKQLSNYVRVFYHVLNEIIFYENVKDEAYLYFKRFLKKVGEPEKVLKSFRDNEIYFKAQIINFVMNLRSQLGWYAKDTNDEAVLIDLMRRYKKNFFLCDWNYIKLANVVFKGTGKDILIPKNTKDFIVIFRNSNRFLLDTFRNIYLYLFLILYVSRETVFDLPASFVNAD